MIENQVSLAKEILQEHEELKAVIRQIERVLEEEESTQLSIQKLRSLRDELVSFREHLQRHFELEEESGFLEKMAIDVPQAVEKVKRLQQEHGLILAAVDESISADDAATAKFGELCCRIHRAIAAVKRHEEEEHLLIQTAYAQDLGAGD
jgi:hypothetical protein